MWAIAAILFTGGSIAAFEAPYLIRKKLVKELCIFILLLVFGLVLSILQAVKFPLPNPLDWITAVCKPISEIIYASLK
jgi:hypothetical protein